jgi:predicted MFS family arabinose efflux permease
MPGGSGRGPVERVVNPGLVRVFVASAGGMSSFFLLLPVVPLYATTAGAGPAGAGLTTAALLLATVAAELTTPRLVGRFGHRALFAAGLVLVGAPALVLPVAAELALILAVSAVRGLGFGIVVVLGSALVADLVPPGRRGEGLGLLGVVIGVPGVLLLPFGVFLVGHTGYPPVFAAAAGAALAGLVALPGLPGAVARPRVPAPVGMWSGLRSPALLRPAAGFAVTAVAAGVVVTFVPLAVPAGAGSLAAGALLVQAAAATVARWWAGRYGDRHGPARLVIPALLTAAAGVLALGLVGNPVAVLAGMLLFGAGFGAGQNASLVLMFDRVDRSGYGVVSALWNLAFDVGMGLGAAGFGLLVSGTGYPVAFAVTGALMLVAVLPAWPDRPARAG